MGFFNKPWKGFKGFINATIPGGIHLTGTNSDRQKYNHQQATNRYHSFAEEANRNIGNLAAALKQSSQSLQSLEQQQYTSQLKGEQLNSEVRQYESALGRFEQNRLLAAKEAEGLQHAFTRLQEKLPAMEGRIKEVAALPSNFQTMFEQVNQSKERLRGLTEEEAGNRLSKYRQDAESLKGQRQETESKIRSLIAEITSNHQGLTKEKNELEQRASSYGQRQEQLMQEGTDFASRKSSLERMIEGYNQQQESISSNYQQQQQTVNSQQQQLKDYITSSQQQLDALAGNVDFTHHKYRQGLKTTGLVQGLALAALGGGLGMGSLGLMAGMGLYTNVASKGDRLTPLERINLQARSGNAPDFSAIARYGLGSPKQRVPELGNLVQALSHFGLPSVPKIADLPPLHDALGKLATARDIEGLSLGLPTMTAASGKKYSSAVLYDADFLKKLRKMSYGLGKPYLTPRQGVVYG